MKKLGNGLYKIVMVILRIFLIIGIGLIGYIVGTMYTDGKSNLESRESYEYARLLKCTEERYDYCPYCGEALHYEHYNNLTEEETNRILNEYFGE